MPTVGRLKIIAGNASGVAAPPKNGPALKSGLNYPIGVAIDKLGHVYVADCKNNVIEKLTLKNDGTYESRVIAGSIKGLAGTPTPGPALKSLLNTPCGIEVDANNNVYIADSGNNIVEKLAPKCDGTYTLSIIAGSRQGVAGLPTPGPALKSLLNCPNSIAIDAYNNLFIADYKNNIVEKLAPKCDGTYMLSILAGSRQGVAGLPTPGLSTKSLLNLPAGVAVDLFNNVYIADCGNNIVERLTLTKNDTYTLSIIAGNRQGKSGLPTAGPATKSSLYGPNGVAIDLNGNIYIADGGNNIIEKLTLKNGSYILSIIAGNRNGEKGLPTNGPARKSLLNCPEDVAVDIAGNVYVTDALNNVVEKITFIKKYVK